MAVEAGFGTLLLSLLVWGATVLFGADTMGSLLITGMLAVFFGIVLAVAYSDRYKGDPRWKLRRRVFTSDDSRASVFEPEFYEVIDGQVQPVQLRFTTPLRMLKLFVFTLAAIFLPLLIAFARNGFSAEGLTLGGAAV